MGTGGSAPAGLGPSVRHGLARSGGFPSHGHTSFKSTEALLVDRTHARCPDCWSCGEQVRCPVGAACCCCWVFSVLTGSPLCLPAECRPIDRSGASTVNARLRILWHVFYAHLFMFILLLLPTTIYWSRWLHGQQLSTSRQHHRACFVLYSISWTCLVQCSRGIQWLQSDWSLLMVRVFILKCKCG